MIINRDINPESNIYYTGGLVLDQLRRLNSKSIDVLELYQKTNESKEISMKMFVLSIDWLFILGLVKTADKGTIIKCF